jgi:diadenosine tetraphosphate (Ap4A) HIT family hydrolase
MLMMVDPNPHFHVIPRYSGTRIWNGVEFPDAGWPKAPQLGSGVMLSADQIAAMAAELMSNFR